MNKLLVATVGATFIALGVFNTKPAIGADIKRVEFSGTVTSVDNVDPRITVLVGDTLVGSFTYDPTVVSFTVNPVSGGPFDVSPLLSFNFNVGTLSGTLNQSLGGFFTPGLINSTVVNVGTSFNTSNGIELRGGNTFNAGGGIFVIGNSGDGGIVGTYQSSIVPDAVSVPESISVVSLLVFQVFGVSLLLKRPEFKKSLLP